MSCVRALGIETEYGITCEDRSESVERASAALVLSYRDPGRSFGRVAWDYSGEQPLRDARGFSVAPDYAHASLRTDDPFRPAPSGEGGSGSDESALSGALGATGGEFSPELAPYLGEALNPRGPLGEGYMSVDDLAAHLAGREWERGDLAVELSLVADNGEGSSVAPQQLTPLESARGDNLDLSSLPDSPGALARSLVGAGIEAKALVGAKLKKVRKEKWMLDARGQVACQVLSNGARFYVDHAHPEYSSPEVLTPRQAALYDAAGDLLALRAAQSCELPLRLYKNNQDGKGASWGAHESYQVARSLPFADLARVLVPFFLTRVLLCGAGRVGWGQKSEAAGFQISQRADFVETVLGLETTFRRPIVNTRDEPHCAGGWRRLHVINGDSNRCYYSTYLRVGSTSALLWALEVRPELLASLASLAPVDEEQAPRVGREISRDLSFSRRYPVRSGARLTAVQIQRAFLTAVRETYARGDVQAPWEGFGEFLAEWEEILSHIEAGRVEQIAGRVEWAAKLVWFERLRSRYGCGWDDARLRAYDLHWAQLGEDSLFELVRGSLRELFSVAEVERALTSAPASRARLRGLAVAALPGLIRASWSSLLIDSGRDYLWRVTLPDPRGMH